MDIEISDASRLNCNYSVGSLTIFHQNIRGLAEKSDELICSILSNNSNPQIICLTEHFTTAQNLLNINVISYVLGAKFSRTNYRGGGVCIYVRQDLSFTTLNLMQFCVEKSIEICALKVLLDECNLLVICVYRSPSGNYDCFLNNIEEVLKLLYKSKNELVLCGDFNINFLEESSRKTQLLLLLKSYNLCYTVQFPTRITETNSSAIDNIFINKARLNLYEIKSIKNGLSDHDAQLLVIKNINLHKSKNIQRILRRNVNEFTTVQFLNNLANHEWGTIYNMYDVNEMFNAFLNEFLLMYDSCFPELAVAKHSRDVRWLTRGIRISCKRKESLYLLCRNNGNDFLKHYYKLYCLILKKVIREAKRRYFNNLIISADNKAKTTWKIIRSETGRTSNLNDELLPQTFLYKNNKIKEKDAAHNFNQYFTTVTDNLFIKKTPVNSEMTYLHSHSLSINTTPKMKLEQVTEEEVIDVVRKSKPKKSSGYDGISNKIIKLCIHQICKPLVYIINKSLVGGIYPDRLKYAVIKPVYKKKGDKHNISNYRPISLVTGFAKIFETIMSSRLKHHIEMNKLTSPNQYGFQKGLSTEDAVFKLTNVILSAWNRREYVAGIFCDITKAFDCVNHDLLLMKLQFYGVHSILLQWLKSYLCNRSQRVELNIRNNKYTSEWEIVGSGVPQGSVLGPLLFNIFINDFPLEISNIAEVIMFADDTSIICSANDPNYLSAKLDLVCNHIFSWFQNNQLMINLDKTQIMKFSPTAVTNYSLQSAMVKKFNEIGRLKFLGIQLDNHLTYKEHLDYLCHKLSSLCFQMRKLANLLNINGLKTIYYAYYHSTIKYGIIHWGNSTDINKVFLIQKKLIRIMMKVNATHSCRDLFKKLDILPVPCVYLLSLMTFVVNNQEKFLTNNSVHSKGTRINNLFHLPVTHLSAYQKGVYYSGIRLFNMLPTHILNKKNDKRLFKSALREFLQSNVFYSINEFIQHTYSST
jgi:exonuclease III